MRTSRIRTVATTLLVFLMVTAIWPAVMGQDGGDGGDDGSMPFAQREDYIAGSRMVPVGTQGVLTDGPLCDVGGTGQNLGGVCFELDGEPHEIDFYVFDRGQNRLWKHGHDLNDATGEVVVSNTIRGTFRMLDADGAVLHEARFCGGWMDLSVPGRAVAMEITLDGALAGLPVDARCPSAYAGATVGWAYLTVDD